MLVSIVGSSGAASGDLPPAATVVTQYKSPRKVKEVTIASGTPEESSMLIEMTVPVAGVGEEQAHSVLLRESLTLNGVKTLVDGGSVVLPAYDGEERVFSWNAPIDGTTFVWLYLMSATGQESSPYVLLPTVLPGVVTVIVSTKDCFGVATAGLSVAVSPGSTGNSAGVDCFLRGGAVVTDAEGVAQFVLSADSGTYGITVGTISRNFDTTGRGGTTVSFASLM